MEHHARLMAIHGHQVQVIAGRGGKFDPKVPFVHLPLVDSRHVDVIAAKQELDEGFVSEKFHALSAMIESQLREHISETDILIAHNVCSLNKNLALTNALFNLTSSPGSPHLILWHHDLAWTTPRYQKELHEGPPWELLKTAWKGVTQVTVSDARQEELCELMGISRSQVLVVPNGVDVERFFKLEQQTRDLVKRLDLSQASPLLLLPVRITPRKNIELALRVLVALRVYFPRARLAVTGPLGPHNPANLAYFERLKELRADLGICDAAHFFADLTDEYMPDAVIADFYRLADALLLPSFEEGFGIPILEAGFSGLPIFCSDIPPLKKLGGEFVTYFSSNAKPESAAKLIQSHLAASPVFNLRAAVRSQYTWEAIYATKIAQILGTDRYLG